MAQESKSVARKENHCGPHRQDEITSADDEMKEIEIPQKKTMYDKVTQVMEKFASTSIGQMIVKKIDRVLKVVEETAKWSLPQDKDYQLERPLPWLLFLTLIVWLRVVRVGLSVASLVVGSQRVTPESMVYYIQIKRRRLRAIRVNGLKSIRSRDTESTGMCSGGSGKKVTFVGKFRTLFGSAICKPGQHRDVNSRRVFVQDVIAEGSKDLAERSTKRPRDDESVDLNLTVDQMLDIYANEDSDADSDYIPKDDEEEDATSTSFTSSSSEETETENKEKNAETPKENENSTESKNDNASMDQSVVETKENGGRKNPTMPKPLCHIKLEPLSDVDSGNEQVQTPKENVNTNGLDDTENPTDSEVAAATEADQTPQNSMNSPKTTFNQLTAAHLEEDKQKSTPGHKSAATLKPAIGITAAAVPTHLPNERPQEKCYKTVTTQTIEIDWSITLKTKISHIKKLPKLEKLNCSISLTPASSVEDIFYSPAGSPQDFHSIFHPAPIVKSSSVDAHSTPKEAETRSNSSNAETLQSAGGNQKKSPNSLNHKKPNYYHNAKHRNKNRR